MSGSKHLNRSIVGQISPLKQQSKYINKDAAVMQGWLVEGDNANVFLSIRFVQHDFECFSDWGKDEMKNFWDFQDKIHQYTWQNLRDQSRKENKSGLAYTMIPNHMYPDSVFRKSLDPDITLFELRVTQKARVHCFRDKSVCYICWLDKDHRICK